METLAQVFTTIVRQPSQPTVSLNRTRFETQTNPSLTPSNLETWQIFPI
ncbi:MAG: hypothetical protein ACLFSH_09695 [Phormidium sp.]